MFLERRFYRMVFPDQGGVGGVPGARLAPASIATQNEKLSDVVVTYMNGRARITVTSIQCV